MSSALKSEVKGATAFSKILSGESNKGEKKNKDF